MANDRESLSSSEIFYGRATVSRLLRASERRERKNYRGAAAAVAVFKAILPPSGSRLDCANGGRYPYRSRARGERRGGRDIPLIPRALQYVPRSLGLSLVSSYSSAFLRASEVLLFLRGSERAKLVTFCPS